MSAGIRSGVNCTRRIPAPGARERFRKQRLSSARHSLEKDVTLRHQRDRAQADGVFLADDSLDELFAQARVKLGAETAVVSASTCVAPFLRAG